MPDRRTSWVLITKCSWLAANIIIWLLGLGGCIAEPKCSMAFNDLFPFLCLLAFPGSMLFLIGIAAFMEFIGPIDPAPPIGYTLLSLSVLTIGYFQWFHVVPALFGKADLIVLGLREPIAAAATSEPQDLPQSLPTPVKIEPPTSLRIAPPKPARINAFAIPGFDKSGRTPLERAINRKPNRRLTNAS